MNLRYFNILQSIFCFSMLTTIFLPSVSSTPLDYNTPQRYDCHPMENIHTVCSRWYLNAQLPNIFGHDTLLKAQNEMNNLVSKLPSNPSDEVLSFMCILYFPPCSAHPSGSYQQTVPLPCRASCDTASVKLSKDSNSNNNNVISNGARHFRSWPVMCHTLPMHRCYVFERNSGVIYVKKYVTQKKSFKSDMIAKVASIESELGNNNNNDGYDLEVVSLSNNQERGRRYDITDLGDPDLFHGWADVQGKGAANDYCRVIGRSKRRFLSCHLAGSEVQGHYYVSKLGFDLGYPGTWFMRDMDGDGKDDYCRCVGSPTNSKVTCMKAGERGFYGSPMQSGSQHTFVMTSSTGCHSRRVNAMFGE